MKYIQWSGHGLGGGGKLTPSGICRLAGEAGRREHLQWPRVSAVRLGPQGSMGRSRARRPTVGAQRSSHREGTD